MKLLKVLSSRWLFSFAFAVALGYVHILLSASFLSLGQMAFDLQGKAIILIVPSQWKLFTAVYISLCIFALFFAGWMLYRGVLEPFVTGKKASDKLMEIDVKTAPFPWSSDKLQLVVGLKHEKFTAELIEHPTWVTIPEKGLFQNLLITGTIGTGKTASVMYPFCKQALFHNALNHERKAGMLILDVKGNFYEKVLEYAAECGRQDDVVLITLGGFYKYNPLHKPNMEPIDLANRSRQVLSLISGGSGSKDSFWNTKSAAMIGECVRLMRLVNGGYVSLGHVHDLVTNKEYLDEMLFRLESLYGDDELDNGGDSDKHSATDEFAAKKNAFDVQACQKYFRGEFNSKAETTIETIKACVTEMTSFFASSKRIHDSFCPEVDELNFHGFEDVINEGKIVVLAMNVAEYPQVARTIAAYMKLDFQAEVQQRTVPSKGLNRTRPVFFICDEYQEFVTSADGNFYGVSREAKCCSIVASQSYTSLSKTLGDDKSFNTLQQNLVNKIWLRSDDKLTIDTAQQLTGKEEKRRYSTNISESMADTKHSKIFGGLVGGKASISESTNVSTQRDFVFEERIFTQTLVMFTGVCFLAHDTGMQEPCIVHLLPYFKSPIVDEIRMEAQEIDKIKF